MFFYGLNILYILCIHRFYDCETSLKVTSRSMALELGHWSGMIVLVEWPVVQVVETTNHINQIQSVISITVMAITMTSLVGVNPLVFFT